VLLDDAAFLGCIDDTKYAEEHGRFGVQTPAVKVLQTGTVRGRGLFAETNIPAGTIVTEVAGERVTVKKMGEKRREQDPRIFYSVKGVEKRRVFHVLGIMDPEDGLGMGTFANDYRGAGGTGVNAECALSMTRTWDSTKRGLWGLRLTACCMLHAACCMLHAACGGPRHPRIDGVVAQLLHLFLPSFAANEQWPPKADRPLCLHTTNVINRSIAACPLP